MEQFHNFYGTIAEIADKKHHELKKLFRLSKKF